MRQPPPITQILRFPLTGGLALLACGVTFAWHAGYSIAPITPTALAPALLPIRFITTILPHINIFHLFFNVYWLWVFGTLLEERFGHTHFALIVILLALGSSGAEWAFAFGGVGLSGVGYGLFGMLVVLSRYDTRFSNAIDLQTVLLFVGWFFLCIFMTFQNIMPVANVAHGAGAILGLILGWIVVCPRNRRSVPIAILAVVMILIGLGCTTFRPLINFSRDAPAEYAYAADIAFKDDRDDLAEAYLVQAVRFRAAAASHWYNLGVARWHLKHFADAVQPVQHAVELDPSNKQFEETLRKFKEYLATQTSPTQPASRP